MCPSDDLSRESVTDLQFSADGATQDETEELGLPPGGADLARHLLTREFA